VKLSGWVLGWVVKIVWIKKDEGVHGKGAEARED
jgi:hypothetical protein